MSLLHDPNMDRRQFLTKTSLGLGSVALSSLLDPGNLLANIGADKQAGLGRLPLVPKAKRVIFLFQSGGPSQMELFDYKPLLNERFGQELPASIRAGQRLTGMTSSQNSFPLAGSVFDFAQYGQSGAWVSELMPHTAKIVDELCFVKSMHTDAINHDPAITFFQTGSQLSGRPSMGSWISYGLGSDNKNLPEFCVLLSRGKSGGQPLYAKLWGSGFLPSLHQGVQFRSGKDPVLYLNNPNGLSAKSRRRMLDALKDLHDIKYDKVMDPEINSRISQYEMAYRMQSSVPDTMNISNEPDYIYDMYGPDSRKPGTFAANCLLARRLAEKDVKFIQLYHQGWDQHGNLPRDIKIMSKSVDQAGAALVMDLKQRGLLEDTLVVWGGEFGRTNYSQGKLTLDNYGRDHHPRCFTMWMAGGGVKKGYTHGETCEFGYNIVKNPVHVHDFQATLLHLLGVDHEKLIFKHQGRRFRLTDVSGHVVHDIIS
ncbi:DUF1501 domain-containing protein [Cyclobacterium amurskyense]|jgi:hypothetical protein|uniref:Sulfatases-like protein n=3 Tax=Cyclobacterium amurskyense TaxID=320787 RepID=A0A0H4PLH3_9BACT|nr:DUF1501 domain-containing protein [Cyclobacterium amurskyense]AKP53885.1 Sulfatases-like protein [Cyclobacterium amurskyense]|tara:strand:- start:10552 stop:11997 length:1446 start_codon:yes stop_codon:yes gene_type:complete